MKPKYQRLLFYTLFFVMVIGYFGLEISLMAKYVFANGFSSEVLYAPRIREITDPSYTLRFGVDNLDRIDLNRSYIKLSGSKYLFNSNEKEYSYFLDSTKTYSSFNLSDPRVVIDASTREVIIEDNNNIRERYSIISELYLYDIEGNLTYQWEVGYFNKDEGGYWLGRTSYLIQNIIWFFAIFGFFKVGKSMAVIYDSKTKKPISGAIVRIYSAGRLVKTYITSVIGFMDLKLDKGKYSISVMKQGYTFPSALSPLPADDHYTSLYYGSEFSIAKNGSRLKFNIPLDPEGSQVVTSKINSIASGVFSVVDNANPALLILLSLGQIYQWPGYIDTWIFTAVSALLLMFKYSIKMSSRLYYGAVVDNSGKSIPNITFNLFEAKWERFVRSFTSDSKGRYETIEVPGEYYITVSNPGWVIVGADSSGKLMVKGKQVGEALFINEIIKVKATGS